MNKLFSAFCFAVFFASCGHQQITDVDKFTISGNIKGSKGDTLFLKLKTDAGYEFTDSTLTDPAGNFTLSAGSSAIGFYILSLNAGSDVVTMIIDTCENITFNSDKNNFAIDYSVKGSPQSEQLALITKQAAKTSASVDSLSKLFKSNFSNPNLAGVKVVLDSIYTVVVNRQRKFLLDFIKQNPASLAVMPALSQYLAPGIPVFDPKKELYIYQDAYASLSKAWPDNIHVIKFGEFVNRFEKSNTDADLAMLHKPKAGEKAIDFKLKPCAGDSVRLSSFKGKYVLLDFWAPWSEVSRQYNDNLVKCYWKYYDKNFTVVQVAVENNYNRWKQAVRDQKLTWTNLSDLRMWNSETVVAYGVRRLPSNFLINPDGVISYVDISVPKLDSLLNTLL